eukprot:gnl/TRDRNA2_/TRDRNA2_162603_c0_seq1.p1 gnl/TRDRNA2_/TRDRNA2_162603_c0~~gnl/TRDRNA2_/TRDRNA2_162603_c0_seq1.p1  ORF type:complete len:284 (-),score=24.34 gnl/TRDRNA2_/TRDRNA2_162603_c0_seq1:192-1043(-)
MQVRFLIQWLITINVSLVMRWRGKPVHFLGRPGHRLLLFCRAFCFASALTCSWTALRLIPVGDSTIIVYLYPIFTGLLARQFLAESLGWSFWCQAGTCCTGVLLVTGAAFSQTSTDVYKEGAALSLLAALSYASANCCVRALKDAETIEIQLFNDTVMSYFVMPLVLAITGNASDWSAWDYDVLVRLVGATGFGLCALLIVLLGHQLAPASKATLFTYLEVPSAFVVQAVAFGEVPGLQKVLGACLIVVAALYRFWAEASQKKKEQTTSLLQNEMQPSAEAGA